MSTSRRITALRSPKVGTATVRLAPIEVEALLQSPDQPVDDPTGPTVEMIPLGKPDQDGDDPKLARGSDHVPTVEVPLAIAPRPLPLPPPPPPPRHGRGQRRVRTTLRVEEIDPRRRR